jgi:hypothetical protein
MEVSADRRETLQRAQRRENVVTPNIEATADGRQVFEAAQRFESFARSCVRLGVPCCVRPSYAGTLGRFVPREVPDVDISSNDLETLESFERLETKLRKFAPSVRRLDEQRARDLAAVLGNQRLEIDTRRDVGWNAHHEPITLTHHADRSAFSCGSAVTR